MTIYLIYVSFNYWCRGEGLESSRPTARWQLRIPRRKSCSAGCRGSKPWLGVWRIRSSDAEAILHLTVRFWTNFIIHNVSQNVPLGYILFLNNFANSQSILIISGKTSWRNLTSEAFECSHLTALQNSDLSTYSTTISTKQLIFNHFDSIHHFKIVNYNIVLAYVTVMFKAASVSKSSAFWMSWSNSDVCRLHGSLCTLRILTVV